MSKHTPGPWSYHSGYVWSWRSLDKAGNPRPIAGPAELKDEEDEANARLIAAAPDLLEALEELLCQTKQYGHKPEIKMAEAAILKSKGEK